MSRRNELVEHLYKLRAERSVNMSRLAALDDKLLPVNAAIKNLRERVKYTFPASWRQLPNGQSIETVTRYSFERRAERWEAWGTLEAIELHPSIRRAKRARRERARLEIYYRTRINEIERQLTNYKEPKTKPSRAEQWSFF